MKETTVRFNPEEACPKCGGYLSPNWDRVEDIITVVCVRCEYNGGWRLPLDHAEEETNERPDENEPGGGEG